MIYERDLQATIVEFLDWALPADAICLVIPGGDGRPTRAPGYKAGTPDILVVYRARAILIELKRPRKSKTSIAQINMHVRLTACGAVTFVAKSLDQVIAQIETMIPLRVRVAA